MIDVEFGRTRKDTLETAPKGLVKIEPIIPRAEVFTTTNSKDFLPHVAVTPIQEYVSAAAFQDLVSISWRSLESSA
jgi:hypothetical protein